MDSFVLNALERHQTPREENPQIGLPNIKVLGLGGGGSNAVNRMIELGLSDVEFIAANTDKQALASSLASVRLQLGPRITRGLGAGGDPRVGASAAMESSREIASALSGADMVFITAGMGGGTGTGAAPIAAEIAQEIGAVVVAIVTLPFSFEMNKRAYSAFEGTKKLRPHTHTLITVPNDRLLQIVPQDLSLEIAFRIADDVLRQGIQGIAELITRPGLINVDFAHVRELMLHGGGAFMAIGLGEGDQKAHQAIQQALHHPLIEIDSLEEASGVLVHYTGGEDLTLFEIGEAVSELRESVSPDTDLILGASTEEAMYGRAQVILIVTGIGGCPVHHLASPNQTSVSIQEGRSYDQVNDEDLDVPAFLRRRRISLG
jgi:cell division protein FtsZ